MRDITQTPDGYLWFTTFDGLVRFDGVRFTVFNKSNTKGIINNRFTGLYSDKDGTLYATTMEDGILTIFRNGEFSSMTSAEVPGHYIQKIQPDESGELRFLVEDEERNSTDKKHRIYPYLLRELPIIKTDQVWCADICLAPPHGAHPFGAACGWLPRPSVPLDSLAHLVCRLAHSIGQ